MITVAILAAVAASQTPLLITAAEIEPVSPRVWPQLLTLYPAPALQHGVEGHALVECDVAARSSLSSCRALEESPTSQGFGEAAVKVAQMLQANDHLFQRQKTNGPVTLVIRFRLPWSLDDGPGAEPTFALRGGFTFIRKPGANDMANGYPVAAARLNVQGRGVMRCRIQADGQMADCQIKRDEPGGYGFGDASLKLAPLFHIDMTKGPGLVASGKEIDIPVRWLLPH